MTKAEKKLQVANIRLLAARQRTMAAGYRRQAAHLLDENIPIRGNKRPKNSQGEGTGKKGEEL